MDNNIYPDSVLRKVDLSSYKSAKYNVDFYLYADMYQNGMLLFIITQERCHSDGTVDEWQVFSTTNFDEISDKWNKIKKDGYV